MTDQSQFRPQPQQQTENRTQQAEPPPVSAPEYAPPLPGVATDSEKKSGFVLGEEKRAAGKAGERNIQFQWIDQWVGNGRSARFNVATAAGNPLEVTIQQQSYSRSYGGVGTVSTGLIPVAPIGTKGKVVCQDTATGEVFEKPWTWHLIGSGGGLLEMIKRLFWKG
jgi:hypothetical protein